MTAPETKNEVSWVQRILVGRNPRFTLIRIGVLLALFILIPRYVLLPIRVTGISMMPNYRDKQIKVVNRLAYVRGEPHRGDVVAVRYAGEKVLLLKRVVGLPGETLSWRAGRLLIDGQPVPEPYLKYPCTWTDGAWNNGPVKIGGAEYYIVGDNRSMQPWDHTQGRVWLSQIVGRAL